MTGPVRALGRNVPLIRFLILALYIIVCLFILHASPLILFLFIFILVISSLTCLFL